MRLLTSVYMGEVMGEVDKATRGTRGNGTRKTFIDGGRYGAEKDAGYGIVFAYRVD